MTPPALPIVSSPSPPASPVARTEDWVRASLSVAPPATTETLADVTRALASTSMMPLASLMSVSFSLPPAIPALAELAMELADATV